MLIKRKALLYDIENLAYTIADTGEFNRHTLHRVRDICQDGNIDRVNRVLALSYSKVLTVLMPIICKPTPSGFGSHEETDIDFHILLNKKGDARFRITREREFNIKETIHEYLVCCVLADWLAITLPEAADVWKFRAEMALESLEETVSSVAFDHSCAFTRRVPPI